MLWGCYEGKRQGLIDVIRSYIKIVGRDDIELFCLTEYHQYFGNIFHRQRPPNDRIDIILSYKTFNIAYRYSDTSGAYNISYIKLIKPGRKKYYNILSDVLYRDLYSIKQYLDKFEDNKKRIFSYSNPTNSELTQWVLGKFIREEKHH